MKRYDKYKDSGVDWISEIPYHWGFLAIKHISRIGYGESLKSEVRIDGEYYVWGSNGIVGKHSDAITKGATVIIGRKGSYGKTNFSETSCYPIDTTFYIDETLTANNLRWLYYALSVQKLDAFSKDSSVPGINREEIYVKHMPLPTLLEQLQIAAYLNYKTSLIDELIAKKKRKIELLKEKRQAIINEAVTKGLNPNAKMKPSGVEWIGEIPEKWIVTKLKYLLSEESYSLKTGPFGSQLTSNDTIEDGQFAVYNQRNVLDNQFETFKDYITTEKMEALKNFSVNPGNILLTTRGTIGSAAEVPVDSPKGVLHPCLIKVRLDPEKILNEWLLLYINQSSYFFENVNFVSNPTTIEVIYSDTLREIVIPHPFSVSEQQVITDYIKEKNLHFNSLIKNLETQIDLLKEYRQSLISEVVTGKLDVREWQPITYNN